MYTFDGRDQVRDSDSMAVGKMRNNSVWSQDGKQLISTTFFENGTHSGSLVATYALWDPNVLVVTYELKTNDNANHPPAKRFWKKK